MFLSVVVATYNRAETIKVTLRKLAEQTLSTSSYEVIVVDDGSPDNTKDVVTAAIPHLPYELRFYRHENRGPGATENRGILEAKGDVILLIADDIHLEPTALEAHFRIHEEHPETTYAALGQVLQSQDMPQTVFQKNWDPFKYFELKGVPTQLPYWKFWACQISLKRVFLLENGLFREHKGAAHEDVELGYRLCQKGLRIFYHPEAMALHYHPENLQAAIRRAYERGKYWLVIEENVPDPQIWVKYHILNWRTLSYHLETFRNLSTSSLPLEDRNFAWLITRQIIRWIAFNRLTVPAWIALLNGAERSVFLSSLVNGYMYRGVTSWYFIKGCRDGATRKGPTAAPRATATSSQHSSN
jgi:glycosyltransferase involved in cell wall biosynthesis